MAKLNEKFYCRDNVNQIAKDLLGKVLYTNVNGAISAGRIVETEAYSYLEKASHAYGRRHTARTAVMFMRGGHSYVYLCYGIHELFNVVTNVENVPEAVLIRAVEPVENWELIRMRRGTPDLTLTSGPGKLTKALGITREMNGISLLDETLWIEDGGPALAETEIVEATRIGVDYAGEDALLPWRYYIRHNPFVSKK